MIIVLLGAYKFGFTSTGLFTVSQIWMPTFGQEAVGMTVNDSLKLLSYYSVGGLISVFILSVLLNKFLRPITVMVIYPLIIMFILDITRFLRGSSLIKKDNC